MAQKPAPPEETPEPTRTVPTPTEQLPIASTPVSATAAASGGATGLRSEDPERPSPLRRHPLATGIAAGVITVVLVSGLTAWGVSAAVTTSLASPTTSGLPMGAMTSAPTAGGTAGGAATTGRLAFRATIQSMDGGSWTILTRKGQTVTVIIDSATQFGTKNATEAAGNFAVGESVVIVATRDLAGNPTATRVVQASALGTAGPTPMPSTSSTPTA